MATLVYIVADKYLGHSAALWFLLWEVRMSHELFCCVFSKTPALELEALFKRHFTQVVFFKGTAMSTRDLERVKVRETAVVVLSEFVQLSLCYEYMWTINFIGYCIHVNVVIFCCDWAGYRPLL